MAHTQVSRIFKPAAIAISTFAAAVAMFGAALTFAPQHAAATPAYAQQTTPRPGVSCVNHGGRAPPPPPTPNPKSPTNRGEGGHTKPHKRGITPTTAMRHSPYRGGWRARPPGEKPAGGFSQMFYPWILGVLLPCMSPLLAHRVISLRRKICRLLD